MNKLVNSQWSALILAMVLAGLCTNCVQRGDTVLETWEFKAAAAKIRLRKFDEKPQIFLSQYYFALESADFQTNVWREVMLWQVDDPIPIQRQQVGQVDERIVYAFGNWTYVVSTDGGRSWSRWDAKRELPDFHRTIIKEVTIRSGGNGAMVIVYKTRNATPFLTATFETADYGVHWSKQ